MKTYTILFFSLFFSFLSCKKKEIRRIDSPLLREAITFKDGSYFVYRDSISGDIDSFWVDGYASTIWEIDHYLSIEKSHYYMYHADSVKRFLFGIEGKDFRGIESITGYFALDSAKKWKFRALSNPQVSMMRLNVFF